MCASKQQLGQNRAWSRDIMSTRQCGYETQGGALRRNLTFQMWKIRGGGYTGWGHSDGTLRYIAMYVMHWYGYFGKGVSNEANSSYDMCQNSPCMQVCRIAAVFLRVQDVCATHMCYFKLASEHYCACIHVHVEYQHVHRIWWRVIMLVVRHVYHTHEHVHWPEHWMLKKIAWTNVYV